MPASSASTTTFHTSDVIQLAHDAFNTYAALTTTAPHHVPPPVADLLRDLEALQKALHQNHSLTRYTRREPPQLLAVHHVLAQTLECIDAHELLLSPSRPPHVRRDSARNLAAVSSRLDHDNLPSRLRTSTLKVKNLNFVTTLVAGFVDFHISSERFQLHASLSETSTSASNDGELINLLSGFARVGYLYHRLTSSNNAQSVHSDRSRQLRTAEVHCTELLDRLLAYTGLQTHPLAGLAISDLIAQCSMEHQAAIISVDSLAARRANDVPYGHGTAFRDCPVTIKLEGHPYVFAKGFLLSHGVLRWIGVAGHVVFEHHLQDRGHRYPWRDTVLHKPLTVSFIALDTIGSKIVCSKTHHPDHIDESPDYVFADEAGYELFQTCLRDRPFLREFQVKSLRTKNADADKTENSVVKFWGPRSESSPSMLTLPVTFVGNQVRHQELQLKWMNCVKTAHPNEVRLDLKQARRRTSSTSQAVASPTHCKRPKFLDKIGTALSRQSTFDSGMVYSPQDVAPSKWIESFPYFTLEFDSAPVRDSFIEYFEQQQRAPKAPVSRTASRMSVPSLDIGSPWLSQTDSTFSGGTPVTMPSGSINTAPTTAMFSGSPKGMTADTFATELDLGPQPALTDELAVDSQPALHWPEFLRRGGPTTFSRSFDLAKDQVQNPFYSNLGQGQIRLVRIHAGVGRQVCCDLEVHSLEDLRRPNYEALSYCWGKTAATAQISTGNLAGFAVSEHLLNAICRLRHESRPRYIWVDAICINQTDIHERNQQISLMRRIYELALHTTIWMGDTDPAKPSCPRCYDDDTLCTLPDGTISVEHNDSAPDLARNIQALKDKARSGSTDLWFRRLWCVQEFHFSQRPPSVYMGRHAVRWSHFMSWFKAPNDSLELFRGLGSFNAVDTGRTGAVHSLFELLYKTGAHRCSDPRDRIFALLGMTEEPAAGLTADYRLSVIRVIEEACKMLIIESGSVDVLLDGRVSRSIWGLERFLNTMPSYIPDFTMLQTQEAVRGPDKYSAGPGVAEVELDDETDPSDGGDVDHPRILCIRAVYFDRISTRTTESDIPKHEHSPNESLIYNSLEYRGQIIRRVLEVLEYSLDADLPQHHRLASLDPTPRFGRLFLDYLLEGQRSVRQTLEDRASGPQHNVEMAYRHQEAEDLAYVRHEHSAADEVYVSERWQTKFHRLDKPLYIPPSLETAYHDSENNDSFRADFEMARDLENVFSYARRSKRYYYLTPSNSDAPMRRDVLDALTTRSDVRLLETQFYNHPTQDLEFHAYNAKARERDFFKTASGFVGLGPSSLEVNDVIVVPLGCSRPLILRRKFEGVLRGVVYELVGDAVIPGIMSGKWAELERKREAGAGVGWYRIR